MSNKLKLSASVMCANLLNLEKDLNLLYRGRFDYLHFDIMDGHFVPMIGLGSFFLRQITNNCPIPVEVHLMVDDPEKYISEIVDAGADTIIFHIETQKDVYKIIHDAEEEHNIRIGIALRPFTPLYNIIPILKYIDLILLMAYSPGTTGQKPIYGFDKRIEELKELTVKNDKKNIDIAIDGGLNIKNIRKYKSSGANLFIFGSSGLFVKDRDLKSQIVLVKRNLNIL